MRNVSYDDNQKFLTLNSVLTGREAKEVPVTLIDELIERELWGSEIEDLKRFRRVTRDASSFEWKTLEELVGADLNGATVYVYHANWEDSEWLSTSNALTVKQTYPGDQYSHQFIFPEVDEEDEEQEYDRLDSHSFYGSEKVLVVRH